jgi:hypothetical protein
MIGAGTRARLAGGLVGMMLALGAASASLAESEFANLPCLDVGANLQETREGLGVSESSLREALSAGLRTRLPRLVINPACGDTLRLIVVLASPSPDVFYGTADMALLRRAIVVDTGQFVRSEVWRMTYVLYGPPTGARDQLLGLVNDMLTRFAADYNRSTKS